MTGRENDSWQDLGDERDQSPLETEQLDLVEEEERLPWLESSVDDDWDEPESSGNLRLLGLVAIALAGLAALVGGIWWITHRNTDPALVADGSLIEAPATPYKQAPKNPGGKTFDGTGDSSFAVSEGQSRPPQLGGPPAAPAAVPAPVASGGKPDNAAAAAPVSGGVGVQVGAFSSQAAAEAGWTKLTGQAGTVLSGVPHRVVAGNADIGKVYRLQAVAGDTASANALCGKLKSAGISCQVK